MWAAGANDFGQLGIDSNKHIMMKTFVKVVSGCAIAVATGSSHSMVLKQDGSVWCTGRNIYGQLGDNLNIDSYKFVKVIPKGAKGIAAGSKHSLVVMQDGTVWATGENKYGQLGDGTRTVRYFMHPVAKQAKAIAAGYDYTLVLKQDGAVWATGRNNFGQLGDGTTTSRSAFVEVVSSSDVITSTVLVVAAGDGHSMLLKYDGSLWATGVNGCGQVGDGTMLSKTVFVRVLPSDGACCMVLGADDFKCYRQLLPSSCLLYTSPSPRD